MKLNGKTAVVTGAAKGIGRGIAAELAEEGASVVVADRDIEAGESAAEELRGKGRRCLFVHTDVREGGSVASMVRTAVGEFGGIDVLVNNAGYHISKNVEQTSEEEWDFIIATNLRSVFLCCKHAIPYLRRTRGSVINISSMVGLVGQSNAGAYSASKGGIIAMSKGMALDFAKDGIRVNVICPGWIQTPLVEDWFGQQPDPAAARAYIYGRHPLGRIGTVEECGKAAVFLASDDAAFITGTTLNVEGGITLGY